MIKLKTIVLKSLLTAGILAGSVSLLSAQTTTNILDNFNRNGALAGSSPNIGDVNSSPTNWVGAFTTTNTGGGGMINAGMWQSAQLPFAPQSGYVYTFSVTANIQGPADGNDRWVGVGFDNAIRGGGLFDTAGPWMLMKQNGYMEGHYNGLNGNIPGGNNAGYSAGTNNLLQIVLDTTGSSNWKAQIKVNGVQYGSTTTLPSGFAISYLTFFNYGGVTTNTLLSVTSVQPAAPVISGQPIGFTNWAGVNGSMEVAASGSQPISYQWYKDSISNPLSGQTGESLGFWPLQGTDSGSYFVVIANSYGSVTSSVAPVYVETGPVMTLTPSISVGALPASGTDAASGIDSANTYLDALNFTTSGTPLDINGVTFSPVSATGTSLSGVDSVNGGSWALSKTSVFSPVFQTATLTAGLSDGSLSTLLSDAAQLSGLVQIGDIITLTFNNLLATGQYRIRLFYAPLSTSALPVTFTFNGRGSNEVVQLDENLGYSINSYGAYYVDYAFTATTNFASATLATGVAGTGAVLAGAVLQQISAPLVAPAIVGQPAGFTNWMTYSNALAVSASGSIPLHYQWYQNGLLLDGQTNNLLSFSSLDATNDGTYRVVVTNIVGSVTSSVANIFVITNGVWGLTPSISVVQIPASGSDAAVGIDPTNLYLAALDFGSDTTALSVNGVNFTQISVIGNGSGTGAEPVFSGTDANYGAGWSLTASDSATDESGFGSIASGGATVQADGNMAAMLTDMSYMRGLMPAGNYAKLTLSGLTPGAQYAFRYYYRQWNANDTPLRPVVFTFDGQGTNESAQVDLDAGGAYYINYQFTAASTNLDVTMTVVNPGNGPHIYGVTLQQTAPASGPTLTSVTPNPVKGSSLPVTLSLTGSGFTGASAVLLTNTTAATGASYTPTVNSDTSISVAFVPGTTASTWNATVVKGSPSTRIGFTVSVPSPVQISKTSVNSAGAGKVVLNGTGGTAGYSYVVVGATNLNPPVVWSPVVTNTFDGSGNFHYTNTVDTGKKTLFLRIQQ